MKSLQNIIMLAVVFGIIISGVLGIMITLDIGTAEEARETIQKSFSVIGILTIVAILLLAVSKLTKK